MKKVFAILLAVMITVSLAACSRNETTSSSQVESSSMAESSVVGSAPESSVPEEESSDAAAAGAGLKEGKTVEDFMAAIDDLYGEMAPADIDDAMLQDLYMVDPANVENYWGKLSLMNVQAFDVLVVQAKEGKVEEVKASLEERKQNRISEFEFYPVNGNDIHTQNALVLTSGDYAILVICDNYEGVQPILDEHFTFE